MAGPATTFALRATQVTESAASLEAVPAPVVVVAPDAAVIFANTLAHTLLGVSPPELVGRPFSALFAAADEASPIVDYLNEAPEQVAEATRGRVFDLRRADGPTVQVELEIQRATGNDTVAVAVLHDVRAWRRAEGAALDLHDVLERRVGERTRQLEEAIAELEAFSYSVSHDLRAPLRALDGFSRILLEDHGPALVPEARRYLEMVRENALHMGRLVDALLAFARLGRQALRTRPVDAAALAAEAVRTLQPDVEQHGTIVRIGELPPCDGDPVLLKQVFVNLIGNAIKFSRDSAPAIVEVGSRREGGTDIFFVRDNGVGFDMEYADKLFGVFQRLHPPHTYEGTGIGLATVQRIVQRHDGRVWAESEPGRGATFSFTIGEGLDG